LRQSAKTGDELVTVAPSAVAVSQPDSVVMMEAQKAVMTLPRRQRARASRCRRVAKRAAIRLAFV